MDIKRHILLYTCLAAIVVLAGCSSAKNTARTRWWQAFNTRYNVYYNGATAYIDGSLEKENGNKDNFTEIIPLYTVSNKASRELGKANFDRAILKAQKAIQLHSIKRRPEWNKQRRKTERDIEWLNRREYNPFMWKVWMLMGRSQFHEGDFDGAASTFSYMSRLYETQPAIRSRAQAWLVKSYIENDFRYDAEDVIRNMRRDSIPWKAVKEWDYALADYYIHTAEYEQAIPYLRKVIRHEMRRKQKAREWFLMGQICQAVGRNADAYKAYGKVIRMNPPYELEFNARVAQTEVMAAKQSDKMIGKLRRMARSDKNADYLDQVYYAMGNIYLAKKDTTQAISAYEKGNTKGTRSGVEKGVLLLKLGDLYWELEKYSDARRCYNEALGMLDKERKGYDQLSNRSKVLDELVPYTDAIHLQDSLQELAKMDEKQRNEAIDRVIEALKKKEKEERKAQDEQTATQQQQQGNNTNRTNNRNNQANRNNQPNRMGQSTIWYFYNPVAVTQGKQQFQRTWGKRDNVDNWQRSNKTVVAGLGGEDDGLQNLTDEQRDSLLSAQQTEDSLQQIRDSAQNDPHKREYYLAQIPFTQEQVDASNGIIEDGLYHSGVIFKDKLDNLPLSEKALMRLTRQYPQFEHMDDVYYHLFLLYSRLRQPQTAEKYVDSLKTRYPDSQWTTLLTDPYYTANARNGVHIEDSLYAATYDAFKADRYAEVAANTRISEERFPLGANRDKFLFIGALGKLNDGDSEACLKDMETLVEKFPTSKLSEMAGMIINGVKAGRKLRGGKFDIGDVWTRRTETLSDSAAVKQKQLSNERNTQFDFMLVYQPDSVNENKLLYQLARFNFTSFLVRNFDITVDDEGDLHRMRVSGFRNYDEALQYARQLLDNKSVVTILNGKARPIIISEENLPLLGTVFSYDDYDKFYNKHFAPLKISTFHLLTEPAEVVTEPEARREPEPTETDVDNYLNETIIGNDEPAAPTGTTIATDNADTPATEPTTTTVPTTVEPETTVTPETTVVEPETTVTPEPTVVEPETTVTPEPTEVPGTTVVNEDDDTGTTVVDTDNTEVQTDEPVRQNEPTQPVRQNEPTQPVRQNEPQQPARNDEPQQPTRNDEPVQTTEEPQRNQQTQTDSPVSIGGVDIIMDDDELGGNNGNAGSQTRNTTRQGTQATERRQQTNRNQQQTQQQVTQQSQSEEQKKADEQKTKVKQQETFDLDDEYYDLDGF